MAVQIRKAERRQAKLRLGLAGPSGSGKTFSALTLALGLGGKVGMIDTEHGSGDLYAHLGDYDIIRIEAPFTVAKYLEALHAFEEADYQVVIIDSLTHAWAGEGGLLDKQGKIADADPRGNSYTAWRKVTPEHNQLVEAMLASPCHLIATVRSKQEYAQEKDDRGKTVVKKLGMAAVQREGLEYEFTVFLDLGMDHSATASKDRTSLFDGEYIKVDKRVSKRLLDWLNTGGAPLPPPPPADPESQPGDEDAAAFKKLESTVADFKLSFVELASLPELSEQYGKAYQHIRAHAGAFGKERLQPLVDSLIAAKDARKAALLEQQGGAAAQTELATGPTMGPDDVTRLEAAAIASGLSVDEARKACGVDSLAQLPLAGYAEAAAKIAQAGAEKAKAAKPARTRRAA